MNGWETRPLIEFVGAISTGPFGSLLHKSDYVDDGVPLVNPINIAGERIAPDPEKLIDQKTQARLSPYILRAGDIVVARRGDIGRCAVIRPEQDGWVCGTGCFFIRPDGRVDSDFVAHLIRSPIYKGFLEAASTGATMQNLSNTALGNLSISVPKLSEQRRIIGILDEAFAGLEAMRAIAEKNLQNARALFESHLETIITTQGHGYISTKLGSEVDLLAGFAFKSAQYTNSQNAVRLLRGDNIIQGALRWDDVKKWPANDVADYARYNLAAGDVVLAMDRPWVKAGVKRAQISADDLPCLLVQRTARLRGGAKLDNRFLIFLVGSGLFAKHILGVQTGSGVPHISGQQIKEFQFSKPPIKEQLRLAGELEQLSDVSQRLAEIYERKLAAIDELKKSLLHNAFSGNL